MYSLTLNFKTKEELLAHLQGEADSANNAIAQEILAANPEKKTRAKKDKDVLAEVTLPKEESNVPSTAFPTAPAAPKSPLPFDRNIVVSNISSTLSDLRGQQVAETSIAKLFANVFATIGVPAGKISELEDGTLLAFNVAFYPEVQLLRDSLAPKAPTAGSFI